MQIYEFRIEGAPRPQSRGRQAILHDYVQEGVEGADIVFIAVGTPTGEDGRSNLSYVRAAAEQIGKHLKGYTVVVDKSTVPVGTADEVRSIIAAHTAESFDVVSNPEFLKEGDAIADFFKPDRVVIGGDSKRAIELMRELYEPFCAPSTLSSSWISAAPR